VTAILGIALAVAGLAFGVFVALLGDAPLARYAVARALRKLPAADRQRYRDEWNADLHLLRDQPLRLTAWVWGFTLSTSALASELALAHADVAEGPRPEPEPVKQIMPALTKSLPSNYELRMALESLGLADDRLLGDLSRLGVVTLVRWDSDYSRRFVLRDEMNLMTGELYIQHGGGGAMKCSVWNLDNELVGYVSLKRSPDDADSAAIA
jgi:hypothetical protein